MLNSLKLKNFRRFSSYEIQTNSNFVILYGENATGKTSILEAIYLLSTAKSPRTTDLPSLILQGEEYAIIEGMAEKKKYKIILTKNGKVAFINDIEYKKMSDYIAGILMVMFSPKDLNLILGSRGERRKFFDLMISLCDKKYLNVLNEYKVILKERNEILKQYDSKKELILEVITKKLSELGDIIIKRRKKFIVLLNQYMAQISKQMDLEFMETEYLPSVDGNLENILKQKNKLDILSKTTCCGPHRDDYGFRIEGHSAVSYASQGQMRSIVICLKLALKEVCELCNKREVILLLDDVFGELDEQRQKKLILYLKKQSQTFITTTSLHEIPKEILENATILQLKKGS